MGYNTTDTHIKTMMVSSEIYLSFFAPLGD